MSSLTRSGPKVYSSDRSEALEYKNYSVVSGFAEKYGVSLEYAVFLFEEVKKWLWLCALSRKLPNSPLLEIYPPMTALDEMWHTFILHTRDYQEYCSEYLGLFVHHNPTTIDEKAEWRLALERSPQSVQDAMESKLRAQLEFVAQEFGAETVVTWYGEAEILSARQLERERMLGSPG